MGAILSRFRMVLLAGYLSCLLILSLFLIVIFTPLASAQGSDFGSSDAIILNDLSTKFSFDDKLYIIEEKDKPYTTEDITKIIINNQLPNYRLKNSYYNMGLSGKTVWVVIPLSSISNFSNWKLSFGSPWEGRYGLLKDFSLYDLNTQKYIYNISNNDNTDSLIPARFNITAHERMTTYLLAKLQSTAGVLTIIKPSLINPRSETPFTLWTDWGMNCLTLLGFLFFVVQFRFRQRLSDLMFSLLWLSCFVNHIYVSSYIFNPALSSGIFIHLTWLLHAYLLLGALAFSPQIKSQLPASLIIGAAALFLISNLAGLVLLHIQPEVATFLIYGPFGAACIFAAAMSWPYILGGYRTDLLSLALTSSFLALFAAWNFLLCFNIFPSPDTLLGGGEFFLSAAIFSSILLYASDGDNKSDKSKNLVVKNTVYDEEFDKVISTPLHEAKELSEHKRLIMILEKERASMAEMQVQAAHQTEEMRRSKEAADEANRAKSAFLAIVSHEIRTPMTGIMGMLRLLQDTPITKEQREYILTMKDSGDAMLALLNDILDYEKIESGKMELEVLNCDLRRLARSIHTLMNGHAASKGIDLVLELDPSVPTWVRCDPTRLRQVILNLLNNAIKFTSNGKVYFKILNLSNDELLAQNIYQLYFAVQDSGIGITPEAQRRLFMPFSQANSSISRKYGGTGLGLAICKRLIETMGGGISISSKEGEGSTFFFTLNLPMGEESQDEQGSGSQSSYESAKYNRDLNVLVVDDNSINQKVIVGFLNKHRVASLTASTGEEALNHVAQNNFDLILMDIELPDISGVEVTEKIRALPLSNKAQIPIAAVTGNIGSQDLRNYQAAGMNDFAPKPITLEKISELLLKADGQMTFPWNKQLLDNSENIVAEELTAEELEWQAILDSQGNQEHTEYKSYNDGIETDVSEGSGSGMGDHKNIVLENLQKDYINLSEEMNFDFSPLDDVDEDTFALAVKQFEEQESYAGISKTKSEEWGDESLDLYGLDDGMLKSLLLNLPMETVVELLGGFHEKAEELVAAIGKAYLGQNANELRTRAHEFKGMAANFGFIEVQRLCAAIEHAAKENNLDAAKEATDYLGERYSIARQRLHSWIENEEYK